MTHLNLMTVAARRRTILQTAIRRWLKVYALLGVLVAGSWTFSLWESRTASEKALALEARYEPIKQLKLSTESLSRRLEELERRERIALTLSHSRSPLVVLSEVSAAARHTQDQLFVHHFQFADAPVAAALDGQTGILKLRGIGHDDNAVTQFVNRLRTSGPFRKVELKSTIAKELGDILIREFHVECMLH